MDYQDKWKEQEEKKKEIPSFEEKKIEKECPICHSVNESESKFCAECGYNFGGQKHCPKCGAKVSPTADICEGCGEWLLEGKCKFCYADIEEGATFCAECGNPVAGIVCPQCGQLSYFDFCKHCNIPLTGTARQMLADMKDDPQKQALLNTFQNYKQGLIKTENLNEMLDKMKDIKFSSNQEARRFFMAIRPPEIIEKEKISEREELLKMKAYIERVDKKEVKKTFTPLFSDKQRESVNEMDKIVEAERQRQEAERQRQEEERRRKEEAKRKQQEEERKRQEEEERQRRKRGWLCNAYGCLHHDGPSGCADPSRGGHWVV